MSQKPPRHLVTALISLCLAAVAGPTRGEVVEIPIPKAALVQALDSALDGSEILIDNFGSRDGSSWHDDTSYIRMPGQSKAEFSVPEYTYNLNRARKYRYYVDDLRLSGIEAAAAGSKIELTLRFESQGEEIKAKCLRWALFRWGWVECSFPMDRDIHLDDTRLLVGVTPVALEGSISYADPSVKFETDLRIVTGLCDLPGIDNLCDHIGDRIEGELTTRIQDEVRSKLAERQLRATLAAKIRDTLESVGLLQPSWNVLSVTSSGANFIVSVERPDTVDGDSVRSLVLSPVEPHRTGSCPATVGFTATIETAEATQGQGYLRYENGLTSSKFRWSSGKEAKNTSTVHRDFDGSPGRTHQGWVEMVLEWTGTSGRTFTLTSNRAEVSVTCSPTFGTTFRSGSLSAGYSWTLDGSDLEDRGGFALRLGLARSPRWSVELGADRQGFELAQGSSTETGDHLTLDLGLVRRISLQDRLDALLLVGLGWRAVEAERQTETRHLPTHVDRSSWAPFAGLGLEYALGRGWSLETRLRQRWIEAASEDAWVTEASSGFTYRFGGRRLSPER